MVNWARLPSGSAFQRHYHEDMEELFIIISGRVEATVESAAVVLETGDAIVISPRESHEMRNIGAASAEYIVMGISGSRNGKTVITPKNPENFGAK